MNEENRSAAIVNRHNLLEEQEVIKMEGEEERFKDKFAFDKGGAKFVHILNEDADYPVIYFGILDILS